MLCYRPFTTEDGLAVKLPEELLPENEPRHRMPGGADLKKFLRERRAMWITWQQKGLPLPDEFTERCVLGGQDAGIPRP